MILFVAYAPLGALKANDDDDEFNGYLYVNLDKCLYEVFFSCTQRK